MPATVLHQLELADLPSASGVEVVGPTAYLISDDAPFLYTLDAQTLAAGAPLMLFETAHFSTGRIPKNEKPDLECLTILPNETTLLACGSGATSLREKGFWVQLAAPGSKQAAAVHPVSLSGLYAALRPLLPAGAGLNLEAAAATATHLLLFQRTAGSVRGVVFQLPLAAAVAYLRHQTHQLPPITPYFFTLPSIEGRPAGFSGAVVHQGRLLVTASVEDTLDPVADGAVLGSFVGWLDLQWPAAQPLPLTQLALPGGKPYRGKVEGVAVHADLGAGRYELLLVTDDDRGGSTIARVAFS